MDHTVYTQCHIRIHPWQICSLSLLFLASGPCHVPSSCLAVCLGARSEEGHVHWLNKCKWRSCNSAGGFFYCRRRRHPSHPLLHTGWSNWILHRKLKYSVCCLIGLSLFVLWHLSKSILNTSISGVKSSWTTLYSQSYTSPRLPAQYAFRSRDNKLDSLLVLDSLSSPSPSREAQPQGECLFRVCDACDAMNCIRIWLTTWVAWQTLRHWMLGSS